MDAIKEEIAGKATMIVRVQTTPQRTILKQNCK